MYTCVYVYVYIYIYIHTYILHVYIYIYIYIQVTVQPAISVAKCCLFACGKVHLQLFIIQHNNTLFIII